MHPEPIVTVVTPAYNVGAFISQAIASVAAQAENRFEYIVVDDGSTDDTAEQAVKAFAGDERMRLIRNEHRGASAARNTGISQARAPFISFIDGDDRWHPEKLAHQLAVMSGLSDEYGVVFSRSRLINEENFVVGLQGCRPGRHDVDDLLVENCPPRNGSSLLFRTSCFSDSGLFSEEYFIGADFEMELRIACTARSPLFWADRRYLIDYRLRSGQLSRQVDDRLGAVEKIMDTYAPQMTRLPARRAYIDLAVLAHRSEASHYIDQWSDLARSSGLPALLRTGAGWRLLGWRALGERGSTRYRRLNRAALRFARTAVRQLAALRRVVGSERQPSVAPRSPAHPRV